MLDRDNRVFVLARQGQRHPSMIAAIAVTFGTLIVTVIGGQIAGRFALASIFPRAEAVASPVVDGAQELLTLATGFLPIYLCVWAAVAMWSKRSFATLGFESRRPLVHALRGAIIAVVMMSAVAVVLATLPATALRRGQALTIGFAAIGGGLLALIGTTVQATAEEVLFRGWLLATVGSRYKPWIGMAVSSVCFSLAHAANPNVTPIGLLNLCLFGAFLALVVLAEGGLWGACAWHTLWNWTNSNVFGLPGSGGPPHSALLMSVTPMGRDFLTGGAFGPDGGIVETAVLLLGISAFAPRVRRGSSLRTDARSHSFEQHRS